MTDRLNDDVKLFERSLEEAEDRDDVQAARAALAESDERIPYEEFRQNQGLDDGPKKQRPGPEAEPS